MLTALMAENTYTKLNKLRHELEQEGVSGSAHVFVPVGALPPSLPNGAARLLFVGRATRDFTEDGLATFEGAQARAAEILSQLPRGISPFWQLAREITERVLQQTSKSGVEGALATHCGWSNLVKIGAVSGNPKGKLLDRQAALCAEALRAEIACFQPTGIVVATGDYAQNEVLEPVFGRDGWSYDTRDGKQVAYKLDTETGAAVAWTDYPIGMRPPGTRAQVQKSVADLIVLGMRGGPLPSCSYRE